MAKDKQEAGRESAAPAREVGRQAFTPECPRCSQGETVVKLKAVSSTGMFTYYACPQDCGYSIKQPRPTRPAESPPRRDEAELGGEG